MKTRTKVRFSLRTELHFYSFANCIKNLAYLFGLIGLLTTSVHAQQTPSDVFRIVKNIEGELALINEASGVDADIDIADVSIPNRLPRHVYQKGREVYDRIQGLRNLNGLEENPLPAIVVKNVTPSDVFNLVSNILEEIKELRDVYGIDSDEINTPAVSGKTPTNIYAALEVVNASLDLTDIPGVSPNDVYRASLMLESDMEIIANEIGKPGTISINPTASGKTPGDVYALCFEVHKKLKQYVEENSLSVNGGITLLTPRTGSIKSENVINLINNILADSGAIKVAIGTSTSTMSFAAQSGKTPSNAFDLLTATLDFMNDW